MLSLYVDSAVRQDVEPLLDLGVFSGITTNPTLLHRAGLGPDDLPEVYRWAVDAGAQEVFMQTWGESADEMESRGRELAKLGERTVIKVVASAHGVRAAARLAADGIPVLLTAVYATHQAVTAAAAGVRYLAPYVGRMADEGRAAREDLAAMHQLLTATGSTPRILAASVRSTADLVFLAQQGVDAFALPVTVARKLFDDTLTAAAVKAFDEITAGW
jgi:transaldolase